MTYTAAFVYQAECCGQGGGGGEQAYPTEMEADPSLYFQEEKRLNDVLHPFFFCVLGYKGG